MEDVRVTVAASRPDGRPSRRPPVASVAICAYTTHRWDDLRDAVASVLAQCRDGDECLVVIDHNDRLLALAANEFAGEPVIRVIASGGSRGLSGARNTAIAMSRGDVIVFLDDDAVAGQGWLGRMVAELSRPGVYGVGSAAVPEWPHGQRPAWFPPEFDWVVGCSYLGQPTEPARVRNVFGVAMGFRRDVFALAGQFSIDVGRIGVTPTGCEETELCIRLAQRRPDAVIRYLPDVAVTHRVAASRVRPGYFLRRCFGEGQSKARVSVLVGADRALTTERAYIRRVLPKAFSRELRRFARGDLGGLAAATMMALGLFIAGCGYVVVRVIGGTGA